MLLPEKIRVSVGTANKLGLKKIKIDVETTNCHLLTYHSEGCDANCAFCPQSKYSFNIFESQPDSQKFLSRVTWPDYKLNDVLRILEAKFPEFSSSQSGFQRICLQSLKYPNFLDDVIKILDGIKKIPVDNEYRLKSEELSKAIRIDKENGWIPFCVVATLGTTSSTSLDPVEEIAEVCKAEETWLHIDAAHAGTAAIVPEMKYIIKGCEFADSFVVNPICCTFSRSIL